MKQPPPAASPEAIAADFRAKLWELVCAMPEEARSKVLTFVQLVGELDTVRAKIEVHGESMTLTLDGS